MSNRTAIALALVFAVTSLAIADSQSVELANAETSGVAVPPTISIIRPNSYAIYTNGVPLNITYEGLGNPPGAEIYGVSVTLLPERIWYSLDGQANVTYSVNYNVGNSSVLTGLSEGYHTIVACASYYVGWGQIAGPFDIVPVSVRFKVVPCAPIISFSSPENRTYNATSVPLIFYVTQSVDKVPPDQRSLVFEFNNTPSWVGYSLDGRQNVTLTGNMTLTGLTDGIHTLVVYANNTSGKLSSEQVNFTINELRLEVSPNLLVVSGLVALSVVVAAATVAYLKKRKR